MSGEALKPGTPGMSSSGSGTPGTSASTVLPQAGASSVGIMLANGVTVDEATLGDKTKAFEVFRQNYPKNSVCAGFFLRLGMPLAYVCAC